MQGSKKIWGIYNTLKESKIEDLNEFEIWMKIYSLKSDINLALNYSKKHKDISIKALMDEQFNLEYLIYYTRKFGVKFNCQPEFGKHIEQSESFNMWYKFWERHMLSMTNTERKNYIEDRKLGKDVSIYLPNVNWNNSTEKNEGSLQFQKVYQ